MDSRHLADIRSDYAQSSLSEESVLLDPLEQFDRWMDAALRAELIEPTAMTLSTVGGDSRPSSRVVLLKGFDADGFVFFTNYESQKGRELAANPNAAIHFFWPDLERQVNIRGDVAHISAQESDEYFYSRPFESRIGAWASHQSERIGSRKVIEDRVAELTAKYADSNVPRPPHWGGLRLRPERFEFWQGRASRLHDRICYERSGGLWTISRLSP